MWYRRLRYHFLGGPGLLHYYVQTEDDIGYLYDTCYELGKRQEYRLRWCCYKLQMMFIEMSYMF